MAIDLMKPSRFHMSIRPGMKSLDLPSYEDAYNHGVIARRIDCDIETCPRFIDEEMADQWRAGWATEDDKFRVAEEHAKRMAAVHYDRQGKAR
jgi:hypothetical protein